MSEDIRPILKEDYDHLPHEPMAGLDRPVHRYANILPIADDKDQNALRASLLDIGLVEPIVLFEGAILDGRHRYLACQKTGAEPKFVDFEGDEEAALKFVLAKNVARRSLTTIQKLKLRDTLSDEIARLRTLAKQNQGLGCSPVNKVDVLGDVAKLVDVGRTTAYQYDKVVEAAAEDDFVAGMLAKVEAGEMSVKKAYDATSDLDKEAKQQSAKVDPAKMKVARAAAIAKAHALLVNHDPTIANDFETAELLAELADWIADAVG